MLSFYQAERTRAEEQLHRVTAETRAQLQQKDDRIQQNEAELCHKANQLQQKDGQIWQNETELGQARTQLQQKTTELNSVQQSLQVY